MRRIKTESAEYSGGVLRLKIPKEDRPMIERAMRFLSEQKGKYCFMVSVGKRKMPRSVQQNYLLWGLLGDYAKWLSDSYGEKVKAEDLYYEAVSRYGVNVFYMVPQEAMGELGEAAKFLERIDTQRIWDGRGFQRWVKLKAVYGSSEYDTEEMQEVIIGVADEMEALGIRSAFLECVKGERSC